MRQVAAPVPQTGEARLQMKRHRVVDFVADAAVVEVTLQRAAIRSPDDELIVDVAPTLRLDRQRDPPVKAGVAEHCAVAIGVRTPRIGPLGEVRRLDAQNRGLERVHPEIAADEVVVVLRLHSVIAQKTHATCEIGIVRGDQTGIAERAEILAREE